MTGRAGADALIVFAKEPRPGTVKSRLAARVGAELAAALYRAIAEEELRRTAPAGDEYERTVFFAPAGARAAMAAWLPGERLEAQVEGDLGARMSAAFERVFAGGARRAAIIGTDVPWVSRQDVREALESLDRHDLCIGPAADGGYYLLAMKRPQPALFRGVAWSTPGVLSATLERASALGLEVHVRRTLSDVDTSEDVAADWGRLRPLLPAALALSLEERLGLAGPSRPSRT